jgi:hypothetical protein
MFEQYESMKNIFHTKIVTKIMTQKIYDNNS